MNAPVILVHLRQPRNSGDSRDDPFWEYGTFGCTGCHAQAVALGQLDGARLGFIQGGPDEHRLVFLTSPVRTVYGTSGAMVQWSPPEMPFKFSRAPLVIDHLGDTDFPLLRQEIAGVNRSTWPARFSSKFRSRSSPLTSEQAAQVVAVVERARRTAKPSDIASQYFEAIPPLPMHRRTNRKEGYRSRLERMGVQ